jgi:type IV pilus assembly protein PilX
MIDRSRRHRNQQGVALATGLVILLIVLLVGVTAIQTTTLDEKMAGNELDRNRAFQAAEAALRDGEHDISTSGRISGLVNFTEDCGASTTASTADDGLCYKAGGYTTPIWTTASMTAAPSVAYHQVTLPSDTTGIAGVSAQPRYLIEGFSETPPGSGLQYFYRVTARGQGASPNTVVWLQSVYKP